MTRDSPLHETRLLAARFLRSARRLEDCPPDDGAEVAFAGRSNAGKSSVLNRLTGRRGLARTSKTPGRTQLLNFFEVAAERRLVDLPGYGYARAAKATRADWQRHVERYLRERAALRGLVLVMDIRHPFRDTDAQLLEWARRAQMPALVLLNKADKLGRGATARAATEARRRLEGHLAAAIPFSAQQGQGAAEALEVIRGWLELGAEDAQ